MALGTILGIVSVIAVVGFIVFAFNQGLKVRPGPESKSETIRGVTRFLTGRKPGE